MKRNNKGFSLVELLIAMAVSSIVLTALVLLVAQSVKSYSKQTSLAQIQSDADVVLNQISKSILEADCIYIDKTDSYVKFYTKTVDDTSIQPLLPSYILLVFPTYLYAKSLTK